MPHNNAHRSFTLELYSSSMACYVRSSSKTSKGMNREKAQAE